jgi:DNA-directed RNA polymerase I subunit RPA43
MVPAPPQTDDKSLLHIERISQYVSLSPASLNSPLPALCASIFSPLLLSYFPPARGIVLAYEDVELSSTAPSQTTKGSKKNAASAPEPMLLRHVDEYTAPFLWATASFLVLRPESGKYMSGRITHQSKTHITLSHLNTFPVSVTKDHLPSDWVWTQDQANQMKKGWDGGISDEGGYWVDGEGEKVEGDVRVRIRDFDGRGGGKGKGFLKVEGSMLSEAEEKDRREKGSKGKGKASGGMRSRAGEAMEVE